VDDATDREGSRGRDALVVAVGLDRVGHGEHGVLLRDQHAILLQGTGEG